ncbi:MAG: hypothetical protein WCL54_04010 [Clostridia bacterium]
MIDSNIVTHYEDWWNRKNTEPLIYSIFPRENKDFKHAIKPWMAPQLTDHWSNWQQEMMLGQAVELTWKTGEHHFIEDTIAFFEAYHEMTGHNADGYSFMLPGFGPGVLSAFITDFTKFNGNTIWFELEKPWTFEQLQGITMDSRSSYTAVAFTALTELVKRLKGRFVFAMPDMAGPLDIISSIRGGQNMLFDTIDYPEELLAVTDQVERLWRRYFAELSTIIDPVNDGLFTNVFRYLSAKPMHTVVCDFSAMISPAMFEEFAIPTIQRDAAQFDGRLVYHLDGPGEIPHVDLLCNVEKLHAIQWVPGAGNAHEASEDWFPLFKKILDRGKRICLGGCPCDIDVIRKLFKAFPKEEFFLPMTFGSEAEAVKMIDLIKS